MHTPVQHRHCRVECRLRGGRRALRDAGATQNRGDHATCRSAETPCAPGRQLLPLVSSPASTARGSFSAENHFFPGLTRTLHDRRQLGLAATWSTVQQSRRPQGSCSGGSSSAPMPVLGVRPSPGWAQSLETGSAALAGTWALFTFFLPPHEHFFVFMSYSF